MNIQSALVKSILERWEHYEWTIQGFGMARTKIADVGRIHVWDSRLRAPLVSDIHAHPWPLHSTVISGELINQRFDVAPADTEHHSGHLPYYRSIIKTGEGGGLTGEPEDVLLSLLSTDFLIPGDFYNQAPEEIHRSIPQDGTVTLLERPQGPPLQETSVFWPKGMEWVSAEPRRPSSDYALNPIIALALARWNAA